MEYFVKVKDEVLVANEAELAEVTVQLYTKDAEGNLVEVDRSPLPTAVDTTTPASTAPAEEISEPTEDERFSVLIETAVDILHSKGWAFGNELQALINRWQK
jgi:hypothetical protein